MNNHEMLEFIDEVEEIILSDFEVKLQEGLITLNQYKNIMFILTQRLQLKANDRTEI